MEHSAVHDRFWLIVTGAVVLVTLGISYTLTTAPRGLWMWILVFFICFVEFAAGIMLAEQSKISAVNQASSATGTVLISGAVIYGIVGFVTIIVLSLFREEGTNSDGILASSLVGETVLFLLATVLLHRSDAAMRSAEQPAIDDNRRAMSQSLQIRKVVHLLRSVKPQDTDHSSQIEALIKDLGICESRLQHCYQTQPAETTDRLNAALSALQALAQAVSRTGLAQESAVKLRQLLLDLEELTNESSIR